MVVARVKSKEIASSYKFLDERFAPGIGY